MSEIKLFVVDMDETFLRSDKTYDVDKFKKVLDEIRDRNMMFAIASGNSYHKLRQYFDDEDRRDMYFAGDNGNYLVKNDELLYNKVISKETLARVVEFFDEFSGYHLTLSNGKKTFYRESEGRAYQVIKQYNPELEIVDSFTDVISKEDIVKVAIMSDHSIEQNKRVMRIINGSYMDVVAVTSGGGWLDIYTHDGGKGQAVKHLQEKYNIKEEETMVFGDSLNDLSMMEVAYYSVAMQNADPELAVSCRYQIGTNQEQAVLDTIESLLYSDDFSFIEEYRIRHL